MSSNKTQDGEPLDVRRSDGLANTRISVKMNAWKVSPSAFTRCWVPVQFEVSAVWYCGWIIDALSNVRLAEAHDAVSKDMKDMAVELVDFDEPGTCRRIPQSLIAEISCELRGGTNSAGATGSSPGGCSGSGIRRSVP